MKKQTKKIIKIKDLPANQSLLGVKFYLPNTKKEIGIWKSQWNKGVWYKKDENSEQIFPLFIDNLKEALEFEVVQE